MLNTECKQCHKKWHHDNAKYCSMCGKKLIDEPEFKVGDYVVELDRYITKIEKINEDGMPAGDFYESENNYFGQAKSVVFSSRARHATPEEIVEYQSALTFHKHGRKPFEVKSGDILSGSESDIFFVIYDDIEMELYDKESFTSGRYTFLKTAEKVNEWLGIDDE